MEYVTCWHWQPTPTPEGCVGEISPAHLQMALNRFFKFLLGMLSRCSLLHALIWLLMNLLLALLYFHMSAMLSNFPPHSSDCQLPPRCKWLESGRLSYRNHVSISSELDCGSSSLFWRGDITALIDKLLSLHEAAQSAAHCSCLVFLTLGTICRMHRGLTGLSLQNSCECLPVFVRWDFLHAWILLIQKLFLGIGLERDLWPQTASVGHIKWRKNKRSPELLCCHCVKITESCVGNISPILSSCFVLFFLNHKVWTKPFPVLCNTSSATDDMWPFLFFLEEASVPQNITLELRGQP